MILDTALAKVFGTKHEREVKKMQPVVAAINEFESGLKQFSDERLAAKAPEFKERLGQGETLDDILPEAFAVCREAAIRGLGMRHSAVQCIGTDIAGWPEMLNGNMNTPSVHFAL